MPFRFHKYEGAGNDFVIVEGSNSDEFSRLAVLGRAICDRHFGVGADGLVLLEDDLQADARMAIFNADGSRADMCGNALRCVGKHLLDGRRSSAHRVVIKTDQGPRFVDRASSAQMPGGLRTEIGKPRLERAEIPMTGPCGPVIEEDLTVLETPVKITALFLGNPHVVLFRPALDAREVRELGAALESHPRFPRRTNVNFVHVRNAGEVDQRTFERGVGETLACGTGASAVCVAGVLTGRLGPEVLVHQPGGDLLIRWPDRDAMVEVTGIARRVFSGEWPEA